MRGNGFDSQWVLEGGTAEALLLEQGYTRNRYTVKRRGARWVLLTLKLDVQMIAVQG